MSTLYLAFCLTLLLTVCCSKFTGCAKGEIKWGNILRGTSVFSLGTENHSPRTPSVGIGEFGYEVDCGKRMGRKGRIVGGSEALKGEFPWMVSVQLSSASLPRHICGGSIVSSYWVLTAAHCVHNVRPGSLTVVAGDHNLYNVEGNEQRVKVTKVVTSGYLEDSFGRDIALLQVKPRIVLDGATTAPICLPQQGQVFQTGSEGILAGWGRLNEGGSLPEALRHVTLPLVDKNLCDANYTKVGYSRFLHRCQICTAAFKNMDSCQGDSGGPLVCFVSSRDDDQGGSGETGSRRNRDIDQVGRYFLCGIVSWGVGCSRPKYPSVYTEVSCYSDWIYRVLYNIRAY